MTAIATPAAASAALADHPLYARLSQEFGYPLLAADTVDAFLAAPGRKLLVFLDDPNRVRESLDLAVIAPELVMSQGRLIGTWMDARLFGAAPAQTLPAYTLTSADPAPRIDGLVGRVLRGFGPELLGTRERRGVAPGVARVALGDVVALVVELFAFRQTDFQLGAPPNPIHGQRYQGVTLAFDRTDQSRQLALMQQQFFLADRIGIDMGRCGK